MNVFFAKTFIKESDFVLKKYNFSLLFKLNVMR